MADNMALMRGVPEARAYGGVPGGIIWTEFMQLALERCRTAGEGAALVGDFCGARGLSCDSATMVAVADPRGAWFATVAFDFWMSWDGIAFTICSMVGVGFFKYIRHTAKFAVFVYVPTALVLLSIAVLLDYR